MLSRASFQDVLRAGAVAAILAIVALPVVGCGPTSSEAGPSGDVPPILTIEQDDLLFTYHVLTNTEGLFDLRRDPRCLKNLVEARPVETEALRRRLCREMGVHELKELQDPNDPLQVRLRGLGYL